MPIANAMPCYRMNINRPHRIQFHVQVHDQVQVQILDPGWLVTCWLVAC